MSTINTNNTISHNTKKTKEAEKKKPILPKAIDTLAKEGDSKKIAGALIATALSAAVFGGYAGTKAVKSCRKQIAKLQGTITKNKNIINELKNSNKLLTETNEGLEKANKALTETKDKIKDILSDEISPKESRIKIEEDLRTKIFDGKIGYDFMDPPIKEEVIKTIENGVELPKIIDSYTSVERLEIPEIASDGSFEFQVPIKTKLNIVKEPATEIIETGKLNSTSFGSEYSNSLKNWDNDKIARDIMQNFYDGHGQTLDGVKIKFEPTEAGKYKVIISGESTYTHDKALLLGSTKTDNSEAAGNYGEGLKITVLKLLEEKGAKNVNLGSQNWKVEYQMSDEVIKGRKIMAYKVKKADKDFDGSYMEFETSDKGLLESLRKTINRFKHSGNGDFKNFDCDSEELGIKILPKGEKGNLYIAGQRFEFDKSYEGLDGFNFVVKHKLPIDIVDPGRDRVELNESHLEKIGGWLAERKDDEWVPRLTDKETGELIASCERYWTMTGKNAKNPLSAFIKRFVSTKSIYEKDLKFKFPDKYIAYSGATDELIADLISKGYVVCDKCFSKIGMKNIKELMANGRAHVPLAPNKTQEAKIKIIKEAIEAISDDLTEEFTKNELDAKIYLFDAKNEAQAKLNKGTLAEAITENGVSKGFWIDKDYLDKSNFAEILATALHELSHKAGGDESMDFSYKLTDVFADYINSSAGDSVAITKIRSLNKLWEEASQAKS